MSLKTFRYRLEFFPIQVGSWILGSLPRPLSLAVGRFLGLLFSWLLPRRRRMVKENLKASFPAMTPEDRCRLARKVWKNIGQVAAEFVRLSDFNHGKWRKRVRVVGEDVLEAALREDRGLIVVGLHYCNWEVTGVVVHDMAPLRAIARPIKNPFVDRWVQTRRGHQGEMDIILHRQAVKGSLKAIREKKAVGILIDQNLYQGGMFTNFFGRPAATTTLPALLYIRTGAPLVIAYLVREGDGFVLNYIRPQFEFPVDNSENGLALITQRLNHHIEDIIRAHPEYWFWVHNRWKRQPSKEERPHWTGTETNDASAGSSEILSGKNDR